MAIFAAVVALIFVSHASAAGVGLLCSNYAAACATALSTFNCTSSVTSACGDPAHGVPETLDNFVGTCTCLAPYYFDTPSGRLQEEIWDAAVKSEIGSMLQYSPSNASQVDFPASVGVICQTGLEWMGCPPGKALVNPTSTAEQPFQCLCGAGFDISTRAVEGVVDYLMGPYFKSLGSQAPPLCADYPGACATLMAAAGCPPASPVGGCAGGAAGDVSSFNDTDGCTCAGPPPTSWDNGGGRLTELFIDDVLKPAVPGDLAPLNGRGPPYNLSASYVSGCATTLSAFVCPSGSSVNPGTSTHAAPFQCSCGSFDASVRVAEDTLDYVMAATMAGIAAQAAAARAAAACQPCASASVPIAYPVSIAVLGGLLLLALARLLCVARMCRGSTDGPKDVESWNPSRRDNGRNDTGGVQ